MVCTFVVCTLAILNFKFNLWYNLLLYFIYILIMNKVIAILINLLLLIIIYK